MVYATCNYNHFEVQLSQSIVKSGLIPEICPHPIYTICID